MRMRTSAHESKPGGRPANTTVALLALALLLALPTAATAAPRNSVGTEALKKGAVTKKAIKKNAVRTKAIKPNAVRTKVIADAAVVAAKVAAAEIQLRINGTCPPGQAIRRIGQGGAVECEAVQTTGTPTGPAGGDLTGSYPNPTVAIGAVGTAKLADNAVDSSKVVNNSLTGADIDESTLGPVPSADDAAALEGIGAAGFWQLGGNAGTNPATDFLGTTDDTRLDLRVNDARALRLEPASDGTNESPNVIGGIADNAVTSGVHSATIAGGGRSNPADQATANRVTDDRGTVGGGADNQAGDDAGTTSDQTYATVVGGRSNTASGGSATVGGGGGNEASGSLATLGGGLNNEASAESATVGGGGNNEASADWATVGGGLQNEASASTATVGGGLDNTGGGVRATVGGGFGNDASGTLATVPGGQSNTAAGDRSFAAGRRAQANHGGAFVWADNTDADMASSAANQFIARASGGFFLQSDSTLDDQGEFLNTSTGAFLSDAGVWTDVSDENLKEGFEAVDPSTVLAKLSELPVRSWSYKAEPGVRHLGPVAQDFHAAFGLGADERHIASLDSNGVALAAIKGLEAELRAERRLRLKQERRFEARLAALERTSAEKIEAAEGSR